MPKKEELAEAFKCNSDGFGMALNLKDKGIGIIKGAMTEGDMFKMLKAVDTRRALEKTEMLLHFRNATDGKISAGNCHPYPISVVPEELQATTLTAGMALAHNGVILHMKNDELDPDVMKEKAKTASVAGHRPAGNVSYPPYQYDEDYGGYCGEGGVWTSGYVAKSGLNLRFSDTQVFIRDFLAPLQGVLLEQPFIQMIANWVNSKFAILTPTCHVLIGDFHEHDDCMFSNRSYVTYTKPATTYTKPYTPPKDNLPIANKTVGNGIYLQCDLCEHWFLKTELVDKEDTRVCLGCVKTYKLDEKSQLLLGLPAGGKTADVA